MSDKPTLTLTEFIQNTERPTDTGQGQDTDNSHPESNGSGQHTDTGHHTDPGHTDRSGHGHTDGEISSKDALSTKAMHGSSSIIQTSDSNKNTSLDDPIEQEEEIESSLELIQEREKSQKVKVKKTVSDHSKPEISSNISSPLIGIPAPVFIDEGNTYVVTPHTTIPIVPNGMTSETLILNNINGKITSIKDIKASTTKVDTITTKNLTIPPMAKRSTEYVHFTPRPVTPRPLCKYGPRCMQNRTLNGCNYKHLPCIEGPNCKNLPFNCPFAHTIEEKRNNMVPCRYKTECYYNRALPGCKYLHPNCNHGINCLNLPYNCPFRHNVEDKLFILQKYGPMGQQRPTSYAKPIKKAYMKKYENKKKYLKNKHKKNNKLTKHMIKKHEQNMIKKHLLEQQHHKKKDKSPKKQKRQIQSIDLPHKQQSKKNKENVVIQEYNKMRLLEKKKESGKIKKIQFEDDADISEEEIITTSLVKSPKKRKSHGTDKKSTKSAEISLITEENIKLYNLEQDNKILQQSKQKKKTVRKHKKQVVKCKYGILCRNIKTPNGCKYHHIPCKKGKNCIFHLHGTCSFYHPK